MIDIMFLGINGISQSMLIILSFAYSGCLLPAGAALVLSRPVFVDDPDDHVP